MLQQLIVNRATSAIDLFAQCVRAELDNGNVPKETREWLAVVLDNAMIRFQRARDDSNTKAIIGACRPRLKAWLLN